MLVVPRDQQQHTHRKETPLPPSQTHQEAVKQWRHILIACDGLTHQGHCGPELLRLASELDTPLCALFAVLLRQCETVRQYCTEHCCEALRESQQLYQHLYVDAYVALDRSPQSSVVNDGETRHNVSLDPEGPFNRIQCDAPCTLVLPSDNETLYKYSVHSTLGTVANARQKVDALWQYYDNASDAMLEQRLGQPLEGLAEAARLCDEAEARMGLVQLALHKLYQATQRDNVLTLYGQCVALMKLLGTLLQQTRQQTYNTEQWRDNVLVRLAESARLLQCVSRPYEQTQSHRITSDDGSGQQQVRPQFSIF